LRVRSILSGLAVTVGIALCSTRALAATDLKKTETNPASVTATLARTCLKSYEKFESNLTTSLAKIAFIDQVDLTNATPWKEVTKTSDSFTEERSLYFSISTTMPSEFPMTLFPVTVTKKTCTAGQASSSTCAENITVSMEGAKAATYQKTVDLKAKSKSVWASFSFSMTLDKGATADTCTFATTLTGVDSNYLWAKRHMMNDVQPAVVEARLFKSFANWAEALALELEK
jgi:hypothetical protein